MATYKVNKGTPVAFRDGAYPTTYPSPHEGELFYNSNTGAFQFLGVASCSMVYWWCFKYRKNNKLEASGSGTQQLLIALQEDVIYQHQKIEVETETYNGTAWTEVNRLP